MAVGRASVVLTEILDAHFAEFIDFHIDIPERERNMSITDFEAGKSYLVFGLELKTDFWQRTPWSLCGLSHWDEGIARSVAQKVISEYDEGGVEQAPAEDLANPAWIHPVTRRFLGSDGELRGCPYGLVNK